MVDYSIWDHIEVSDDEDETHPNIDTASLFRWRHKARVERVEQFQKEKDELDRCCRECKQKVAERQHKLRELEVAEGSGQVELERPRAEPQQQCKEEQSWKQKLGDTPKKSMPWNVDTLSKDGFSKSTVNTKPEKAEEDSEEAREQKHKACVEKYEKQSKHFGMLHRWYDRQKYLSDNVHLVCEETANYLVIWCIDLEVEEKCALMEQVAHQTMVMQFILELAKSLKGAFRGHAKLHIEKAMKEYEEEEHKKRLGPGGLDPVEVSESLPEELQKCFDVKDVQMLQDAISKMDPTDAKYHMQRYIDSGLWVPSSKSGEAKEWGGGGPWGPIAGSRPQSRQQERLQCMTCPGHCQQPAGFYGSFSRKGNLDTMFLAPDFLHFCCPLHPGPWLAPCSLSSSLSPALIRLSASG
ncbi:hypothetical protein NN561_009162 [Cricetulus griseus]